MRAYEQLLLRCRNQQLNLKIEIKPSGLLIAVRSDFNAQLTLYREIQYKPEQILKMQRYLTGQVPVEFVHVFTRSNKQLIAKPFNKAELLPINAIEWITNEPDKFWKLTLCLPSAFYKFQSD